MNAPSQPARVFAGVDLQDPAAVLARAFDLYAPNLALASSFSMEDVLLIALAHEVAGDRPVRVFALDTGRLHDETYACAEAVRQRFGLHIEWHSPDREPVQQLIRTEGLYSFRQSLDARHACCGVRKVAPLKRALAGLDAWVTGQRRAQSLTRTDLGVIEGDAHLAKLNPLAHWTLDEIRAETRARGLPYNALYDQGFPSIGCAPCTRAIGPGEDERAGRWWWEQADHKECGLHGRPGFEALAATHPPNDSENAKTGS